MLHVLPAPLRGAIGASLLSTLPVANAADRPQAGQTANPLLGTWATPDGVPPYDRIRPEHYQPAFDMAIAEAGADIQRIARVAFPGELWLHLPMNGNADDASGNGRHAKLVGGTSFDTGRASGNCAVFDGNNGYVALPDGAVSALGDFTVATWVQVETTVANTLRRPRAPRKPAAAAAADRPLRRKTAVTA